MPIIGNTVRLKVEFRTFDGQLVSPENIKLKIYQGRDLLIGEFDVECYEKGKCQYDYKIPTGLIREIYFEFSGTLEGLPIVARKKIVKEWV